TLAASPTTQRPQGNAQPITPDNPVTGHIDNQRPVFQYRFMAQGDMTISVQMTHTSGDLDSYLILTDGATGEILAENDDNPNGTTRDSYLGDFVIPHPGEYIITATRYQQEIGVTSGDFTLVLRVGAGGPRPTPPIGRPGDVPLRPGQPVEGVINADMPVARYVFDAQAGAVINIRMVVTSGNLDPLLVMLDGANREILRNDDAGPDTRNAAIQDFTVPTAGHYTVLATRYGESQGVTTGGFSLTFELGGTSRTTTPDNQRIQVGEPQRGALSNDHYRTLYIVSGQAGETYDFTMTAVSGDLDPLLIVIGPDGRELARNDDETPSSRNSRVGAFRLPAAGDYTVVAARFGQRSGGTSGDYEVMVTQSPPGASPAGVVSQPIAYNENPSGTLSDAQYEQTYVFQGRRGDVVSVRMAAASGGEPDTLLILQDALGDNLAYNDDSEDSTNSFIRPYTLPEDGFYTILATRYQRSTGTSTGDYTLGLSLVSRGIPGQAAIRYAFYDVNNSGTLYEDGTYSAVSALAGDSGNGDDTVQDIKNTALLTFALPPLQPGQNIENAVLDLQGCIIYGEGFSGLGSMTVYNDPFGHISGASITASPQATVITTLDTCGTINVADLVRAAYQSGTPGVLQFRIEFSKVVANQQDDVIYFSDPRLAIYVR
ncbi:MAG: hypothetical protein K8I60_14380, partial [Anaerolineae bacterium]|nr:hypothetical protein [Anaerolineae bacterium]